MRVPILLAALVVAVVGVTIFAVTQQRRMLYFPDPDPGPAPAGWSEVMIPTGDGLELSAWHRSPAAGNDRPLVLVFPGNAGNRAARVPIGDALAARGFPVLLVEYRGYGGNPGEPGEEGLAEDAISAARFAATLASGRPLVYFGESLGAAVATGLATSEPPAAMVLVSPFTSLADVARVHYPWAPTFLIREAYRSLSRVSGGALGGIPVLVVAGSADTIVPVEQSKAIADAVGAEWHEVPGADHNDPALRSAPSLVDRVVSFLDRVPNGSSSDGLGPGG